MTEQGKTGEWIVGEPVFVEADAVARYAEAIDGPGNDRLTGPPDPAEQGVPATFPVTLVWSVQSRALDKMYSGPGLGLHGEQAFAYHRPIRIGMTLQPRARIVAVAPKRGGSVVICRSELRDDAGPVCTQLFTLFQVDEFWARLGDAELLDGDPGDLGHVVDGSVLGERTDFVAADQPHRYARASGDTYRIHTDEEFARSQGLDGIILHGLCTLGIAARAVVDLVADGKPERLGFLAARFAAPVRPGQSLTTTVSGISDGSFATVADGVPVLTRGRWAVRA